MNYHKINLLIFSFVLVFLFSLTSACAPDSKLVLPAAEQHTDNDIAEDDNLDTPETEIVSAPDTNISVPLGGDSETTIENTNETATDTVTVKESGEEANTGIQFKKNQKQKQKKEKKEKKIKIRPKQKKHPAEQAQEQPQEQSQEQPQEQPQKQPLPQTADLGVSNDPETSTSTVTGTDTDTSTDTGTGSESVQETSLVVDDCYSKKTLPCDGSSAYNDPACYISSLKADLRKAQENSQMIYVAISQEAYQAQESTKSCPWSLVNGQCPWGSDTHDGLSRNTALATFYQALYTMYELQNHAEDKNSHFVLKIVGGDYYYREPIIISAKAGLLGKIYLGPRLYENGQPVKKNNKGEYVVWDPSGNDNAEYNSLVSPTDLVIANITVEPYDQKPVTLDGGCRFEYRTLADGTILNPDHPDYVWGYSYLNRTCDLDLCTAEELEYRNKRLEDPVNTPFDGILSYGFCNGRGMVNVIKGDNIEVKKLNIQNAPTHGIQVQSWTDHVWLYNNTIKNTDSSGIISMYNKNVLVEANSVTEACASGIHENVSIGYTEGFAVIDNTIFDGWHDEKFCTALSEDGYIGHNEIYGRGLTGVYVASGSEKLRVDGNRIHDLTQNTCLLIESEDAGPIRDIIFENNLCYNNPAGFGIAVTQYNCAKNQPGDGGVALFACEYDENMDYENLIITNNTIYQTGMGTTMGYGLKLDAGSAQNLVVANNIFSNNVTAQVAPHNHMLDSEGKLKSNVIMDNNLIFCEGNEDANQDGYQDCLNVSDRWYTGALEGYSAYGPGLFADPYFVNPIAFDFSLQAASPALNTAVEEHYVPAYDQNCHVRQAGQVDLGAFERIP